MARETDEVRGAVSANSRGEVLDELDDREAFVDITFLRIVRSFERSLESLFRSL